MASRAPFWANFSLPETTVARGPYRSLPPNFPNLSAHCKFQGVGDFESRKCSWTTIKKADATAPKTYQYLDPRRHQTPKCTHSQVSLLLPFLGSPTRSPTSASALRSLSVLPSHGSVKQTPLSCFPKSQARKLIDSLSGLEWEPVAVT